MALVPEDVVEQTWRRIGALDPVSARRGMELAARRQPALLPYVMAYTDDSRPVVRELAVYLYLVVLNMFYSVPAHRLRRVTPRQLDRAIAEREASLEKLSGAHPRFLEPAARALIDTQPHVLRYVTEAILEPEDEVLEDLTQDEQGLLFLVLGTVIEVLDGACAPKRR